MHINDENVLNILILNIIKRYIEKLYYEYCVKRV